MNMENKTFNGDKGLASHKTELRFKYTDSSYGLFNNWNELIDYWAPYYDNKADADRHFRNTAYGVAVSKDGTQIMSAPVSGPLSTNQKADLMARAAEYIINR